MMLEIRYIIATNELTGWCGDETQFGNLDRGREAEAVAILDINPPDVDMASKLYNPEIESLVDNPAYVEPLPPRDFLAEVDKLKARVEKLEVKPLETSRSSGESNV